MRDFWIHLGMQAAVAAGGAVVAMLAHTDFSHSGVAFAAPAAAILAEAWNQFFPGQQVTFAATAEATVKVVLDLARFVPGLSWLLNWGPLIEDSIALAPLVEADASALMATPEWKAFIASAAKVIKQNGGAVTVDAANQVTDYTPPTVPSDPNYTYAGEHGKSIYIPTT